MKSSRIFLIHIILLSVIFFPLALLLNNLNEPGKILYPLRNWTQLIWYLLFFIYIFSFSNTRKQVLKNFNYKKLLSIRVWITILVVLLFMILSIRFIISIDPFADFMAKYSAANGEQLMDIVIGLAPLQMILSIILIGPIFEEIYFRELLVGQLGKVIPLWLSIIISSIIFGFVFHGGYPIWGTINGLVLAFLYVSTKSWSVPLMVHVLWNSIGLFTEII